MISLFSFVMMALGVIAGSVAVLLLKRSVSMGSLRELFFRGQFWGGVILFGVSLLLYVLVLQREKLSVVYPLGSTTYLVTTALSVKYLGEKMTPWKWLALGGIVLGVSLIAIGN